MNHNKFNLKVGQVVMLDVNYNNSSKVKILYLTPNSLFATVCEFDQPEEDNWDVMTSRLTPI